MPEQAATEFLDRVREVVAALGTQKEAAEKTGIPYATLQRILAGKSEVGFKRLEQIAAAGAVSVEYILTGNSGSDATNATMHEAPIAKRRPASPSGDSDLVQVQEIDLRFGLGATDLEVPVTAQVRTFSRAWLRQYTRANAEKVYFAQGIGDSMAPTIHDSDLLLIDTSEQTIRVADKIWAVAYSGSGMVKRLRQTTNGVRIMSDNPAVPDETAYDGELHILGRVVGIFRKM